MSSDVASAGRLSGQPASPHRRWLVAAAVVALAIAAFGIVTERSGELRLGLTLVFGSFVSLLLSGRLVGALPLPFSQTGDGCVIGPTPLAAPLTVLTAAATIMAGALLVMHVRLVHPDLLQGPGSSRMVGYSILVSLGAPYFIGRALVTIVQRPRLSIGPSGVGCGRQALQWPAVSEFEIVSIGRISVARIKGADEKTKFQCVIPDPHSPEGEVLERLVTKFWGRPLTLPKVGGNL